MPSLQDTRVAGPETFTKQSSLASVRIFTFPHRHESGGVLFVSPASPLLLLAFLSYHVSNTFFLSSSKPKQMLSCAQIPHKKPQSHTDHPAWQNIAKLHRPEVTSSTLQLGTTQSTNAPLPTSDHEYLVPRSYESPTLVGTACIQGQGLSNLLGRFSGTASWQPPGTTRKSSFASSLQAIRPQIQGKEEQVQVVRDRVPRPGGRWISRRLRRCKGERMGGIRGRHPNRSWAAR